MSNITIDVEFLAGTSLRDAAQEAKDKALMWGVSYIKFNFNGVSFSIGRNADIDFIEERYHANFTHIVSS